MLEVWFFVPVFTEVDLHSSVSGVSKVLMTAKVRRVCAKCSGHATTAKMLCDAKQRQHQHSSSTSALTPTVSVDVYKSRLH